MDLPLQNVIPRDVRIQLVRLGVFFELGFQLSKFLWIFLGQVNLVRCVSGPGSEIEEEGPVRCGLLLTVDACDGFIGNLIFQVPVIRTNVSLIFYKVWLVLVGLRAQETKEVIEPFSSWPVIEGADISGFFVGSHSVLPDRERVVAVIAKDLSDSAGRRRQSAIPARESCGQDGLREPRFMHSCAVTARQQGCPCWSANGASVEIRIAQSVSSEVVECRSGDESTERVRRSEADIIEQDQNDVGGVGRRPHWFRPILF